MSPSTLSLHREPRASNLATTEQEEMEEAHCLLPTLVQQWVHVPLPRHQWLQPKDRRTQKCRGAPL